MCALSELLQKENRGLELIGLTKNCRYHKKGSAKFECGNFFKDFKCLELFHAVYPKALALMYGGQFQDDELVVRCPAFDNSVTVRLLRLPVKSFKTRLLNKIKQFIHPLWPADVLNYIVYVEVLSVQGICACGCAKKDRFEIYHSGTICPQALYSVFPLVLVAEEENSCQCPSPANRVTFRKTKCVQTKTD